MTGPIVLVSVSGGKDSTATLLLALERTPRDRVFAAFADTGNEHEETYAYVDYLEQKTGVQVKRLRADFTDWMARKRQYMVEQWPAKGVPQDVVDRAVACMVPTGIPFLDLCLIKARFPSRRAQFCTEHLKTIPLDEYALELIDEHGEIESWQGIRAEESAWRAGQPEREDLGGGFVIVRPILQWKVAEVFAMHRKHGIDPNPLYRQGMSRVGCMPCINAAKEEIGEIAARFPEHIDRIEEWERIVSLISGRGKASFFPTREAEMGTMLDRSTIRLAVEWASTTRGGTQRDLLKTIPPPTCSSSYGLCE